MARQSFQVPPSSDHTGAILWSSDGQPILEMWSSDYMIHEPDGSISTRKLNTAIELMCGTMWHPGIADRIPIGVCQLCRQPPYTFPFRERARHGIVSRKMARTCVDCGRLACPKHIRQVDGAWRCVQCAGKHRALSFLRSIFFRCEDE